ncbi:hypothetical protein ACFSHT_22395 [Paraburkholderia silviterrae]|uniref:Uncharacterized protein n=1 Tax=Paraburkholderia silviterrae TaxID=2528715 RepID=A0A4R5MF41_9BURK|nr:hypothetical protein [Paraburkholderia silviterrae]TDG25869.1 hypothetical protein EYW47_00415 [Paraburkholderia silviterrae]
MTKYTMILLLVPDDEKDQVRFTDGSMHVDLVQHVGGEEQDCAALLHRTSIDVVDMLKSNRE